MAIAFDATTDGGNTTATSLTYSHTCTGSNRILFVSVIGAIGSDNVTGATYAGAAMTLVDKQASARSTYLFYLIAPATGANNVVVSAGSSSFIWSAAAPYPWAAIVNVGKTASARIMSTNNTVIGLPSVEEVTAIPIKPRQSPVAAAAAST